MAIGGGGQMARGARGGGPARDINQLEVGDKLTPQEIRGLVTGTKRIETQPKKTEGEESALEKKKLQYPLNDADLPDEYQGRIIFNVMLDAEADLGRTLGKIAKHGQQGIDIINKKIEEVTNSKNPADNNKALDSHYAREPEKQPNVAERPLRKADREVSLYLPIGLQYRDNVSYDNMDIGGMGAGVESALNNGKSALKAVFDSGFRTLSAGLKGSANKDVAKVAGIKLVSALPDEISGAFRSAAGVTSNPNTRVLFKSVGLRDFSFVFKFIPTSRREAEEVKEIVKLFRTELYPESIIVDPTGTGSGVSIGYRFPNKFQIDIEYRGEHIATKIKPCYLRDVTVTYNNTAMSMHSDGNFQETEMTLAFQESRTLNRRDVEEGF